MSATAAERAFAGRFDASRSEREAREPAWLGRLREEAFSAFAAQGLPTTRLEDWRFTSLAALAKLELGTVADRDDAVPTSGAELLALGPAHRMVFVNGRISPALSSLGALPAGCRVAPLSEVIATDPRAVERVLASAADAKKRPVVALNSALFADGVFVELSDGAVLDRPVHALFLQSGAGAPIASHVRSLISAGAGSRGLVVEHHAGTNSGSDLTDAVTEIRLGETAALQHVLVQELPGASHLLAAVLSRQDAGSRLGLHSIALGAGLARVELEARLEGERAELEMNGLYLGRDAQHQDHHTTIDHAAPRTSSRELVKGVLDGRAHGVFHGRVHVRPDAQGIDADQTNRTLLLSDAAKINSKPQLEIHADDVKCSHGATIGQLDDAQLFYLRARGLDLASARALLTVAFASEVLAKLPSETLRDSLERALLAWLPQRGAP